MENPKNELINRIIAQKLESDFMCKGFNACRDVIGTKVCTCNCLAPNQSVCLPPDPISC